MKIVKYTASVYYIAQIIISIMLQDYGDLLM